MPLDPNDPYYRQEVVPPAIDLLGVGLREAYHQPPSAFGAKGNTVHYSGYHRSRRWILHSADSAYGAADYSVRQSLDKGGDEDWVSAFDFTPGVWGSADNRAKMRELTSRVYTAAKNRDPRLADLREFAGTIDGSHVITFNCSDGSLKSAFDSSHLDHCHGSFWRSRAANDHSGILAVMLGEEDMGLTPTEFAEIVQGDLDKDNVLHWRLRGIQDSEDPALLETPFGKPETPGLKQLAADLAELKARPPVQSAPVDVNALVAALVANPAFAKLLQDSSFEGAQRAERE